jgi:hypothetical protein
VHRNALDSCLCLDVVESARKEKLNANQLEARISGLVSKCVSGVRPATLWRNDELEWSEPLREPDRRLRVMSQSVGGLGFVAWHRRNFHGDL